LKNIFLLINFFNDKQTQKNLKNYFLKNKHGKKKKYFSRNQTKFLIKKYFLLIRKYFFINQLF